MNMADGHDLLPAWTDSVRDAQASFRCILKALAEPGTIQILPTDVTGPAPLDGATTALCLTLADFETPIWLSDAAHTSAVELYLRFHCGCPLATDPACANFAIITNPADGLALERFAQGSMEYPDCSTTLLVQVQTLTNGPPRQLSGPGIQQSRTLRVVRLPHDFDMRWQTNHAGFPLGVDIVFCYDNAIVGLPRTTSIHS